MSSAVTTVVMVLMPVLRGITPDAVPEATATPFTFMVAVPEVAVGVTLIELVA